MSKKNILILIGLIFLSNIVFTAHFFNRADDISLKYEYKELLEKGGYGQVVKGIDRQTQKPVAIKIIEVPLSEQFKYNQEVIFLRYIKAMGGHPNIINLIDSFFVKNGTEFGTIYIVLDLIEEGDLLKYIENKQPFDSHIVKEFASQLVSVFSFLEELGIAHCDIKPDNIMTTKNTSGTLKLVIIDFGFVKFFNKKPCQHNYFRGSLPYMPAECFNKSINQDLSKRDPFSMGVILYTMLSPGLLPWNNGHTQGKMKNAIIAGDYFPLSTKESDETYNKLAEYTHRLLSREQSERIIEDENLNLYKNKHLLPLQKAVTLNVEAIKFIFYYQSLDRIDLSINEIIDSIVKGEDQYINRFYEFLCMHYPGALEWPVEHLKKLAEEKNVSLPEMVQALLPPKLISLSEDDSM